LGCGISYEGNDNINKKITFTQISGIMKNTLKPKPTQKSKYTTH
jgi:hypothetical protein